eukprot:11738-Amphidinium_carterae.1
MDLVLNVLMHGLIRLSKAHGVRSCKVRGYPSIFLANAFALHKLAIASLTRPSLHSWMGELGLVFCNSIQMSASSAWLVRGAFSLMKVKPARMSSGVLLSS